MINSFPAKAIMLRLPKRDLTYVFLFPGLKPFQPLLKEEIATTVDVNVTGKSCILCPEVNSQFNDHSGAIRSGLSHLAIPRGWSWGGPASPYCPIWAEIQVPELPD